MKSRSLAWILLLALVAGGVGWMLRSSGKSADSTELERRSAQRSSERDALESFDWSADLPPWQVEADAVVVNLDPEFEVRLNDALARLRCGSEEPFKELIREWAETDPEQALHWLMKSDNNVRFDASVAMEIFRIMATKDPEKALALAESALYKETHGELVIFSVLEGWARHDPEEAIRVFNEYAGDGDRREYPMMGFAASLAKVDPKRAAELVTKEERLQFFPFFTILHDWAESDFDAAMAWTKAQSGDAQGVAYQAIGEAWGKLNPQEALAHVMNYDKDYREPLVEKVLTGWAAIDPDAATQWLEASPFKDSSVLRDWSRMQRIAMDPEEAIARYDDPKKLNEDLKNMILRQSDGYPHAVGTVLDLQGNQADPGLASDLAREWVKQDRPGMEVWISGLEEGPVRQETIEVFARHLAMDEPEKVEY
jgi:hypothetical protein